MSKARTGKTLAILALAALLLAPVASRGAEVVTVLSWDLHSSFWMSLHQRLIEDASQEDPSLPDGLSPEEGKAWREAVAAYREAAGSGNMTFSRPMEITTDALTQVADDAVEIPDDAPLAEALRMAAPVYRRHRWPADDEASRFFIAYAAPLLREAGPELIRRHEAAYGTPWPDHVRAYITPAAGPFGAYTIEGLAGGLITTMSCRDEGYQGLRALEMLLHEASHGIVGPNNGTVAEAIADAAEKSHVPVPRDLWHAILFATSSELTRQALARRGIVDYVPSSEDLFTRVWPAYRQAVWEFWIPHLDGHGTLEEAIGRIVATSQE